MKSHESTENYLETIFVLGKNEKKVRSIDIVNELGFSKPSVSIAMRNLRAKGYIEIDGNGYIILTCNGQQIAESIYERHMLISDWLIFLGVERNIAINDACRMEHAMSEQSFVAIKNHVEECKLNSTLESNFTTCYK